MKKNKNKSIKSIIALSTCGLLAGATGISALTALNQKTTTMVKQYDNRNVVLARETGNQSTIIPTTKDISASISNSASSNAFDNQINVIYNANQPVYASGSTAGSENTVNIQGNLVEGAGGRPKLLNDFNFGFFNSVWAPNNKYRDNSGEWLPSAYSPKALFEGFTLAFINYLYNSHSKPEVWKQIQEVFGSSVINEQLFSQLQIIKTKLTLMSSDATKRLNFDENLQPLPDYTSQTFNFTWDLTQPDRDGKKIDLHPFGVDYRTPEPYGFNYDISIGTLYSPITYEIYKFLNEKVFKPSKTTNTDTLITKLRTLNNQNHLNMPSGDPYDSIQSCNERFIPFILKPTNRWTNSQKIQYNYFDYMNNQWNINQGHADKDPSYSDNEYQKVNESLQQSGNTAITFRPQIDTETHLSANNKVQRLTVEATAPQGNKTFRIQRNVIITGPVADIGERATGFQWSSNHSGYTYREGVAVNWNRTKGQNDVPTELRFRQSNFLNPNDTFYGSGIQSTHYMTVSTLGISPYNVNDPLSTTIVKCWAPSISQQLQLNVKNHNEQLKDNNSIVYNFIQSQPDFVKNIFQGLMYFAPNYFNNSSTHNGYLWSQNEQSNGNAWVADDIKSNYADIEPDGSGKMIGLVEPFGFNDTFRQLMFVKNVLSAVDKTFRDITKTTTIASDKTVVVKFNSVITSVINRFSTDLLNALKENNVSPESLTFNLNKFKQDILELATTLTSKVNDTNSINQNYVYKFENKEKNEPSFKQYLNATNNSFNWFKTIGLLNTDGLDWSGSGKAPILTLTDDNYKQYDPSHSYIGEWLNAFDIVFGILGSNDIYATVKQEPLDEHNQVIPDYQSKSLETPFANAKRVKLWDHKSGTFNSIANCLSGGDNAAYTWTGDDTDAGKVWSKKEDFYNVRYTFSNYQCVNDRDTIYLNKDSASPTLPNKENSTIDFKFHNSVKYAILKTLTSNTMLIPDDILPIVSNTPTTKIVLSNTDKPQELNSITSTGITALSNSLSTTYKNGVEIKPTAYLKTYSSKEETPFISAVSGISENEINQLVQSNLIDKKVLIQKMKDFGVNYVEGEGFDFQPNDIENVFYFIGKVSNFYSNRFITELFSQLKSDKIPFLKYLGNNVITDSSTGKTKQGNDGYFVVKAQKYNGVSNKINFADNKENDKHYTLTNQSADDMEQSLSFYKEKLMKYTQSADRSISSSPKELDYWSSKKQDYEIKSFFNTESWYQWVVNLDTERMWYDMLKSSKDASSEMLVGAPSSLIDFFKPKENGLSQFDETVKVAKKQFFETLPLNEREGVSNVSNFIGINNQLKNFNNKPSSDIGNQMLITFIKTPEIRKHIFSPTWDGLNYVANFNQAANNQLNDKQLNDIFGFDLSTLSLPKEEDKTNYQMVKQYLPYMFLISVYQDNQIRNNLYTNDKWNNVNSIDDILHTLYEINVEFPKIAELPPDIAIEQYVNKEIDKAVYKHYGYNYDINKYADIIDTKIYNQLYGNAQIRGALTNISINAIESLKFSSLPLIYTDPLFKFNTEYYKIDPTQVIQTKPLGNFKNCYNFSVSQPYQKYVKQDNSGNYYLATELKDGAEPSAKLSFNASADYLSSLKQSGLCDMPNTDGLSFFNKLKKDYAYATEKPNQTTNTTNLTNVLLVSLVPALIIIAALTTFLIIRSKKKNSNFLKPDKEAEQETLMINNVSVIPTDADPVEMIEIEEQPKKAKTSKK